MSVIYRAKDSNVILAAAPQADPVYEADLRAKGIEFTTVTVTDPAPGAAPVGQHAAELLPKGKRVVYYRKAGGAVLAVLVGRDQVYERQLERAGEQWAILDVADHTQAPNHAQLQRAAVRDGKVQLDREDAVH